MKNKHFEVVYLSGRWYVVHVRTKAIVSKHDSEASARSAAR